MINKLNTDGYVMQSIGFEGKEIKHVLEVLKSMVRGGEVKNDCLMLKNAAKRYQNSDEYLNWEEKEDNK